MFSPDMTLDHASWPVFQEWVPLAPEAPSTIKPGKAQRPLSGMNILIVWVNGCHQQFGVMRTITD